MINKVNAGKSTYLLDTRLSLRHKGLLTLLLYYPSDKECTIKNIAMLSEDSENIVTNTMQDLIACGYVERKKGNPDRTSTGRYQYRYTVYDTMMR